RPAARLFGIGAGGAWLLAAAGIGWQPLGRMGTASLLTPALWFAVPPAVYALTELFHRLARRGRRPPRLAAAVADGPGGLGVWGRPSVTAWSDHFTHPTPFLIGLGPERTELVSLLRTHTGPEARVLWEDRSWTRAAPRWTALLPLLTNRAYVGGLAPDAC